MKYAYLKYGNSIEEVSLYVTGKLNKHSSSLTYIKSFLDLINSDPAIVISFSSQQKETLINNVLAKTCVTGKRTSFIKKVLNELRIFIYTFKELYKFNPDKILCAASTSPLYAAAIYSILYKKLLIHSRHTKIFDDNITIKNKLDIFITKLCMQNSNKILCHGPFLYDQILSLGIDKNKIEQFETVYAYLESLTHGNDEHHFSFKYLLYAGRMEKNKGIFDLLDAYKKVANKHPDVKLVFAGTGGALPELKKTIEFNELSDKVIALDHVPIEKLVHIMKDSIAVVTPTRKELGEGRCKTVLEALYLGVPVIAPDYGAFKYAINDKVNGLLYRPDSTADLANSIYFMLNNNNYTKIKKNVIEKDSKKIKQSFAEALQKVMH